MLSTTIGDGPTVGRIGELMLNGSLCREQAIPAGSQRFPGCCRFAVLLDQPRDPTPQLRTQTQTAVRGASFALSPRRRKIKRVSLLRNRSLDPLLCLAQLGQKVRGRHRTFLLLAQSASYGS